MFDHCVWYTLYSNHRLPKLIRHLSEKFHTDMYRGHITIHSHQNATTADHLYKLQSQITKPWFKLSGRVYQTKTISKTHNSFYALQQDYHMYGIKRLGDYHVSLAYRINRPFTEEEIAYANGMVPVDTIWSCEFYLSLNDCRTLLPKHWNQLKRHIF